MGSINWEIVSACADVVMAATAIIAAWYALRQYSVSLQLHEIEQITSMYRATTDVVRHAGDHFDHATVRDILNLLETHERLIAYGLLSKNAVAFYRDAISINEDLRDIHADNLNLIRDVLHSDERGYRHLIAALRAGDDTKYIINW